MTERNPEDGHISLVPIERRHFLGVASGVSAIAARLGDQADGRSAPFVDYPYTLGVASGDPLPEAVVIWTRLAPRPLEPGGGMPQRPFSVQWRVATDERMRQIVRAGTILAHPQDAHTVHVDVRGLMPRREYYYQFKAGSELSPVGRTKTAPAPESRVGRLAFAFASCQNYAGGYFSAYRDMVEQDLDLVVYLGDYIYEGGAQGNLGRGHVPAHEIHTLSDYRVRLAQYKTDPDLQQAHAAFPWVVTLDDHEIENNWAAEFAQNYPDVSTADFLKRRAVAFQAYWEHMPLRLPRKPVGPDMPLYRRLTFGDLAEFSVLDTRQYRSNQVENSFIAPRNPDSLHPSLTMLGAQQERWLFDGLERSESRWNVLAQQTVMAQYDYDVGPGESINHDQWDGYVAARNRIFDFIREQRPTNPVVIAGDWHSSWVNDLKADFGDPSSETLATEFVGTSITSGCPWRNRVETAMPENPHVKFFNGDLRGYVRCSLTQDQWQSDFRVVSTTRDRDATASTLATFVVADGEPGAELCSVSRDTPAPTRVRRGQGLWSRR